MAIRKFFKQPVRPPLRVQRAVSSTRSLVHCWRLWHVLALWPTGILCGIVSGALMNAINGWLAPDSFYIYFEPRYLLFDKQFLRWETIVQHGVWEGFCIGVYISLFFVLYVAAASQILCPYRVSARALLRIVGLLWAVWFLCGLNVILL